MVIERQNNEIVIRPNLSVNMEAIQKVIDYSNVLEIVSQNKGTVEGAAELANEVNGNWRKKHKARFLV